MREREGGRESEDRGMEQEKENERGRERGGGMEGGRGEEIKCGFELFLTMCVFYIQ